MSKRIPLTQGKEAIVSDRDYAYLRQWNWCYGKNSKNSEGYAKRAAPRPRKATIKMHKIVAARMNLTGEIDHRNGDKLDNRRCNLRGATGSQNRANRGAQRNNTSGFKGVCWSNWAEKWVVNIQVKGKQKHVGYFEDKHSAARAYNRAALKHYGQFAHLNHV